MVAFTVAGYTEPPEKSRNQGNGSSCLLINGDMLAFYIHVIFFYFCEISPCCFYNKENNTKNFIGREIKVSHIELI